MTENISESSEFKENCNKATKFYALEEFSSEIFSDILSTSNEQIIPTNKSNKSVTIDSKMTNSRYSSNILSSQQTPTYLNKPINITRNRNKTNLSEIDSSV